MCEHHSIMCATYESPPTSSKELIWVLITRLFFGGGLGMEKVLSSGRFLFQGLLPTPEACKQPPLPAVTGPGVRS